jgi:hypothetical protein
MFMRELYIWDTVTVCWLAGLLVQGEGDGAESDSCSVLLYIPIRYDLSQLYKGRGIHTTSLPTYPPP